MNTTASTTYAPSSNSAPVMKLPEQMDGYIDLKTLADIHRFLSQSELDDDLTLAAWIKEHYLFEEPIQPDGRLIGTTEGFSKLDRAYRRVRSLTNKAQDKWPFFHTTWKIMSSTAVKNNARSETASGTSSPGLHIVENDVPSTDSPRPQTGDAPPAPSAPFIPFSGKRPQRLSARMRGQQQPSPSPSTTSGILSPIKSADPERLLSMNQPLETSLPSDQSDQLQSPSASLKSLTEINDQVNGHDTEIAHVASQDSVRDEPLAVAVSEDTANRKLNDDKARSKGRKQRASPAKTERRRSTRVSKREGTAESHPLPADVPEVNTTAHEGNDHNKPRDETDTKAASEVTEIEHGVHDNDLGADKHGALDFAVSGVSNTTGSRAVSEFSTSSTSSSRASQGSVFTLAAWSEPVRTNLDRLPPGSLLRKRKREHQKELPAFLPGPPPKRARSSELPKGPKELQIDMNDGPSKSGVARLPARADESKPITRRSRRQAASASAEPEPVKTVRSKTSGETNQEEVKSEDQPMEDSKEEESAAGKEQASSGPVRKLKPSLATIVDSVATTQERQAYTDLLELGFKSPNSTARRSTKKGGKDTPSAGVSKPKANGRKKSTNTDNKVATPVAPEDEDAMKGEVSIEFLARVQLPSGEVAEIPMMSPGTNLDLPSLKLNLNPEAKHIVRYAEWASNNRRQGDISFKAYNSFDGSKKKT